MFHHPCRSGSKPSRALSDHSVKQVLACTIMFHPPPSCRSRPPDSLLHIHILRVALVPASLACFSFSPLSALIVSLCDTTFIPFVLHSHLRQALDGPSKALCTLITAGTSAL
ncbi:hypothetical protein M752DRAFT_131752 [Aspergillus phoenicis ATCC 13157]|uniref:Uncharacterized protein n=1 Tax=Aspergillus phoenicis ATCC 13157 TaxID=1353007 RepID=A0A370PS74_ASPPH|nr:hypothetical protein M752DRAFT_131752 [Aspergillus phoenicis ATCC 13157]